jgi:TfoX/Sxy family transcriptional regulator of competence genes
MRQALPTGDIMAFDETLASRVRPLVSKADSVVEKKMFGGLAFLVHGNMSVGVHGSELIVRIDPSQTEEALKQPGVRIFDITGRPMKGWLLVSGTALDAKSLQAWVGLGVSYAGSLPPK